jgi:hypothetical protein
MQIKEKLKVEMERLTQSSPEIIEVYRNSVKSKDKSEFIKVYQGWFTLASRIVKLLAPERSLEFNDYYKSKTQNTPESKYTHKGEQFKDEATYTILDYILGAEAKKYTGYVGGEIWDPVAVVEIKLNNQIEIINSIQENVDCVLFDLQLELLMELQDRELMVGREIAKKNLSSAGTLAGVVLENHLKNVIRNRNLNLSNENSGLVDLNNLLKEEGIIDPVLWRKIQNLGDVCAFCLQNSEKQPDLNEIENLIAGVEEVIKTVF